MRAFSTGILVTLTLAYLLICPGLADPGTSREFARSTPYLDANDGIVDPPLILSDCFATSGVPVRPLTSRTVRMHEEAWHASNPANPSNAIFYRSFRFDVYQFDNAPDAVAFLNVPGASPYTSIVAWSQTPEIGDHSFENHNSICFTYRSLFFFLVFPSYSPHNYMLSNAERALAAVKQRIHQGSDDLGHCHDGDNDNDRHNNDHHDQQ